MIERRWDPDAEIIFVTATGAWTIATVEEHYAALRVMIDDLRRQDKAVRILSDVTNAERQNDAIEANILDQMARTFRPGDRVAILTGGAEDQQYVRSKINGVDVAVFSSRLPAEMWLVTETLP